MCFWYYSCLYTMQEPWYLGKSGYTKILTPWHIHQVSTMCGIIILIFRGRSLNTLMHSHVWYPRGALYQTHVTIHECTKRIIIWGLLYYVYICYTNCNSRFITLFRYCKLFNGTPYESNDSRIVATFNFNVEVTHVGRVCRGYMASQLNNVELYTCTEDPQKIYNKFCSCMVMVLDSIA